MSIETDLRDARNPSVFPAIAEDEPGFLIPPDVTDRKTPYRALACSALGGVIIGAAITLRNKVQ